MKFLKYFVFFVLAMVLLFIAIGFVKPTIQYGHEITVDKPLKEAWAVHKDESKYAQWLDGFKSMELISGEAHAVGSKYKVIVNPGEGQDDFEMIQMVESVKDFDHVRLLFDSEMMDFDQTTSYSEKNGKTIIKTDSKVKGKGMMMRSMFALMEMFAGSFHAKEVENMEALKKVIESNTTNYYPAASISNVKFGG